MIRSESARIAKLAWAAFPHVTLDEFVIEAFHVALHDVEFKDAFDATRECLREPGRNFPPTQGQIIAAVRSLKNARKALPEMALGPDISKEEARSIVSRVWASISPEKKKVLGI
jgi:hypothetical protein